MKKKQKKEKKQVVEIHIYIHQNGTITYPQVPNYPLPGSGGTGGFPIPPYVVT